jgi:four helix bundle protein
MAQSPCAYANHLSIHRAVSEKREFGLVMSMRRSAAGVSMKIGEACGREDGEPYASGLRHARGLGVELEYLMLLAFDLKMIDDEMHKSLQGQIIEVRRMLSGVIKLHSPAVV